MDFAIVDLSTSATATDALGGPLTPALLDALAAALEVYANRDVATYWGGAHRVRAVTAVADGVLPGEIPCVIMDDLSVVDPGADAFHLLSGTGVPAIDAGRAQAASVLYGPSSLAASLSHEIAETIGDPCCNRSADDGKGFTWHLEIADPVEADVYTVVTGGPQVSVSNFVLPDFWNPYAVTGLDMMGLCTAPFTLRPGGYITRRPTAGGDVAVWGKMSDARMVKVRSALGRAHRRGLRV